MEGEIVSQRIESSRIVTRKIASRKFWCRTYEVRIFVLKEYLLVCFTLMVAFCVREALTHSADFNSDKALKRKGEGSVG